MPHEIAYDRDALTDMKRLPKRDRVRLVAEIRRFLAHEPTRESKSRIRRLRGPVFPPYRLRIDPYRILYDVQGEQQRVVIHGIGLKPEIYARLDAREEQDDFSDS